MPSARLTLREEDVVRLALEFLYTRELHISQLSLERETGVINGDFSGDVIFLRQLILDGQWSDVFEFIQPLEALKEFDRRKFTYAILRHKYVELLCIKSEAAVAAPGPGGSGPSSVDSAVSDVVKVLNEIERVAPSKEEYSNLCLLLTLPRLTDHLQYKDWNPSNARVQCFREVFPLVEKFLVGDRKQADHAGAEQSRTSINDRLVHLIIKGILYESCVNYCQVKATGTKESENQAMSFSHLLDKSAEYSDSDLSLLSWLQSIPSDTFAVPFEQRTLNVDIERLERPSLETSWTEHMQVTPIKPKAFPHSAIPFIRPRSAADVMSRSLLPALDGLSFGLAAGQHSPAAQRKGNAAAAAAMAASTGGINTHHDVMSQSTFASFHLTGYKNNKLMNTSVDRLFGHEGEMLSSYTEHAAGPLPAIQEAVHAVPRPAAAAGGTAASSCASTPEHRSRDSPASTARSSRRDSLSEKQPVTGTLVLTGDGAATGAETVQEAQRQRRLQDTLQARQADREDMARHHLPADNRLQDHSGKTPAAAAAHTNGGVSSRPPLTPAPPLTAGGGGRSSVNSGEAALPEGHYDAVRTGIHTEGVDLNGGGGGSISGVNRPKFVAVTTLEDAQAVRCAEFHPNGKLYAVGSNSKTLRICAYPKLSDLREDHSTYQPSVLFKRTKHHKGSIYCLAWTPIGDLMATGSNDKTVKIMRFNTDSSTLEGQEVELTMHNGTIRDLCFLEDTTNKSSLLISAGAGDCNIYLTDCATGVPFQALSGHSGHVLSLYNWGGAMFVSGSQDKTVRFWDLRTRGCVNVVTPVTASGNRGSPVAATSVDPSGRLLVSGHEDSYCVLFDIRGSRNIQCFKPHASDVRSVRFSPSAYYLLTTGYDAKIVLTDLQGDLTMPLPSVVVAQHQDKVISGRWHPSEFSFLSTSADRTCTLWALPPV